MPQANAMTEGRDIAAEKQMLDKSRPSKTRTWPNNGLFYHLAAHKDRRWRAVVCANENEARSILGPDALEIIGSYAWMEPEDKVVWDTPGVEFVKVEFSPPLWVRRDEVAIQPGEPKNQCCDERYTAAGHEPK